MSGLVCYTDRTKKICLIVPKSKIFCIYILIQRYGFVNNKIHIFEHSFVFNKFFDIFHIFLTKGD